MEKEEGTHHQKTKGGRTNTESQNTCNQLYIFFLLT